MKTIAIIEARMTSERLPGKVMLPLGGRPALAHVIERARLADGVHGVVVASPSSPDSQPIVDLCIRSFASCYLGSEHDVLSRVYHAAQAHKADYIVQLTGDCPLVDTMCIETMIDKMHLAVADTHDGLLDKFVTNMTAVDPWPLGFAVQIFSFRMLKRAHEKAQEPRYREHTGLWMSEHYPKLYHYATPSVCNLPRLTLDYPEDYELLKLVFENNPINLADLEYLFQLHPEWKEINKHCIQKVPV